MPDAWSRSCSVRRTRKALDETGVTGEAALALLAAMGAQP